MKRIYIIPKKEDKPSTKQIILVGGVAFIVGCLTTLSMVLNARLATIHIEGQNKDSSLQLEKTFSTDTSIGCVKYGDGNQMSFKSHNKSDSQAHLEFLELSVMSILRGLDVLVAIASFDFSQIPHLEEVLDSYHDLCIAGSRVDVVIYATVPYPVTLIDLWNTRFLCPDFKITITLKPRSLRLHLVDCHRPLFYEKINQYDLFIYTEDDIRVTPTTVAAYLYETRRVEALLQGNGDYQPSDFNVGIVRYEYNYPSNVIIDDNTRHATQNVTRVYWEHSGFKRPVVNNAVTRIQQEPLHDKYVSMKNHHQGMFLATRNLLLAWKDRKNCNFDIVRKRPGVGSQPTEGTQRVWMSSQMLYGGRHCNVQQLLPLDSFGALTVLHLPNKNYRRVGKYHNRKFADGTEVFETPSSLLLSAMELHLSIQQVIPRKSSKSYKGIRMVDEVDKIPDRTQLLERRMKEYNSYVERGGVLSDYDMARTELVEQQ